MLYRISSEEKSVMSEIDPKTEAILAAGQEGDEWEEEIKEAREARQQKTEWLKNHPRPVHQPAMMQRRTDPRSTLNKVRSITLTMQIGMPGKN
jgi:hypothetical protein